MGHRPRTLVLVSVGAALAFVVARIVYRAVFGGASTGATPLPSLPRVELSGPFSHIILFGPITLEGIGLAALSAIPFAIVILATGMLVALFDPRGLVVSAPRMRVGSSLLLAMGLAVSTFPSIIQSAMLAREVSRLRGIRPGIKSLISVLELTLEKAMGLAVALESRGIRGHSSTAASGPPVALGQFLVPGRMRAPLTATVHSGSRILLTGATGSGKSTLLGALAGVLELRGDTTSVGSFSLGVGAEDVAYLPHDPHSLFLTSRVLDDVALGLVTRGLSRDESKNLALMELENAGLAHLADREPSTLSSGEAALVALCVLVVTKPALLLLDEPLSALDDAHGALFMSLLDTYANSAGATVIMTDHPHHGSIPSGYEAWQMGDRGLVPGRYVANPNFPSRGPAPLPDPDRVLEVRELSVAHEGLVILNSLSVEVSRGETVLITGDNGAGKSTLLEAIAQGLETTTPHLSWPLSKSSIRDRVATVALVPSEPGSLFLCSSVADELALADRVAGVPSGFTALTFRSLLPTAVETLGATHPRDLSRGQQACLAIALQMSHKPSVLLLDEPTRGLDEEAEAAFREVVGCVVETGTAVVIAAHHRESGNIEASRVLRLEAGRLIQETVKKVRA